LLAASLAGCGTPDRERDKAGSDTRVVLRLAQTGYAPGDYLAHFIDAVGTVSGGDVQVVVLNTFGSYAPDAEMQVVRAVAAGQVDLGWVGSSTFDSVGVTSLEALSAPLLIDSYAVENAVLTSPLADQLLAGIEPAGVTGLGMSPGAFQLPMGVKHPLLTPGDWKGVSFGTYPSKVQEQAIRALGATPFPAIGDGRAHALDTGEIQGFNIGFPFYGSSDLPAKAPYVTANVRLWAAIGVGIANPDLYAGLTRRQRRWLVTALAQTRSYAAGRVANQTNAIRSACDKGAQLVNATPVQLAALRSALEPVYADLNTDPKTSSAIAQIRRLAAATPPESPTQIPSTCSTKP
jgi:TRAP-type C4-dicarboxylate transport system substrate-binding protein